MKRSAWILVLGLVLCLGSGCAHWVRLETPEEFKKKKMKEDPPISYVPSSLAWPC